MEEEVSFVADDCGVRHGRDIVGLAKIVNRGKSRGKVIPYLRVNVTSVKEVLGR